MGMTVTYLVDNDHRHSGFSQPENGDFPQLCEITVGYLCLKVTWDLTSASKLEFKLGIEA